MAVEAGSVELSVDQLDDAAGGYVLKRENNYDSFPYVTINDQTGKSVTYFNTLGRAKEIAAMQTGVSAEVISEAQYEQIFGKKFGS